MLWGHISFDWKLCNQPNTKWVSDDESIVLYVENSCKITGTMRVNGEDIEVYQKILSYIISDSPPHFCDSPTDIVPSAQH